MGEIVWLTEERTYAYLVRRNAFFSLVRYSRGGIDYEIEIENDEYVFREDHAVDYESE